MLVMSSRFPSTLRDDVHLGPIEQGEQLPSPNQSENQDICQILIGSLGSILLLSISGSQHHIPNASQGLTVQPF